MDTCIARLFHPAMEGGNLAPAQDRAETKNQLAHDSEAGVSSGIFHTRLLGVDDGHLMKCSIAFLRFGQQVWKDASWTIRV
jgi:hypothetical protein